MSTITREKLYSLDEIRPKLPVRRSLRTLKRWALDGALVKTGCEDRVLLEVVCIAGAWHTSFEAFDRFLQELTRARFSLDARSRNPRQR
jgi:hypothetical protein